MGILIFIALCVVLKMVTNQAPVVCHRKIIEYSKMYRKCSDGHQWCMFLRPRYNWVRESIEFKGALKTDFCDHNHFHGHCQHECCIFELLLDSPKCSCALLVSSFSLGVVLTFHLSTLCKYFIVDFVQQLRNVNSQCANFLQIC
ncbi:hypothetical protein ACOME3_003345 [Neoechinorhynchus agilis]